MKASEIDVVFVDDYLQAEGLDNNKIEHYIKSAKNYVMKKNDYTEESQLDENEYLTDLILFYIQELYDKGYIEDNKFFNEAVTMDKRYD